MNSDLYEVFLHKFLHLWKIDLFKMESVFIPM